MGSVPVPVPVPAVMEYCVGVGVRVGGNDPTPVSLHNPPSMPLDLPNIPLSGSREWKCQRQWTQ